MAPSSSLHVSGREFWSTQHAKGCGSGSGGSAAVDGGGAGGEFGGGLGGGGEGGRLGGGGLGGGGEGSVHPLNVGGRLW